MTDINLTGNSMDYSFQTVSSRSVMAGSDSVTSCSIATEVKQENEESAVYEKGEQHAKNSVYSISKMNAEDRANLVEKLKAENEARVKQLYDIVNQMLSKQAGVTKLADLFSPDNLLNVSEADILQAKEDISEDGYWGVKQTSQRLFDFACALAGDDVDKMKEMQEAMLKGYKQAEKTWGGELPSLCSETLDAANKLFDDYYASKGV